MTPTELADLVKRLRKLEVAPYELDTSAPLEAADALESLRAAPAVPEGFVLVPKEPTDAMCAAAMSAWDDECNYMASRGYVNEGDAGVCYRAMLAASGKESAK